MSLWPKSGTLQFSNHEGTRTPSHWPTLAATRCCPLLRRVDPIFPTYPQKSPRLLYPPIRKCPDCSTTKTNHHLEVHVFGPDGRRARIIRVMSMIRLFVDYFVGSFSAVALNQPHTNFSLPLLSFPLPDQIEKTPLSPPFPIQSN